VTSTHRVQDVTRSFGTAWDSSAVVVVAAVAKKLRCWLGWHHWVYINDEGKTFRRCADCDKFGDTSGLG
jgi:hypothetical protein